MITYNNIEVSFGDFVAIPNLNLEIKEGDFFTFLGPSGCGKTTALRTLAGLEQPSAGTILIDGKDVTGLPSHKRDLRLVFQNYALFPTMTVFDNIAFGLKVAKTSKSEIEDRVREIAKEVNLTDEQLQKNVAALSGGQQQRVAIARALVVRPKILLLDEPLSNLDARLRHSLRGQLKDLQEHFGITTIYVTHDQEEALVMSDKIAVMNAGSIEQLGTPRELYADSATEFVCTFLGDANRLQSEQIRSLVPALAAKTENLDSMYLRVEKLHIQAAGQPLAAGQLTIPGTVVKASYQGTFTSYTIDAREHGMLKAIVKEDDRSVFAPGDAVDLIFNPENILCYDGTTGAAKPVGF